MLWGGWWWWSGCHMNLLPQNAIKISDIPVNYFSCYCQNGDEPVYMKHNSVKLLKTICNDLSEIKRMQLFKRLSFDVNVVITILPFIHIEEIKIFFDWTSQISILENVSQTASDRNGRYSNDGRPTKIDCHSLFHRTNVLNVRDMNLFA